MTKRTISRLLLGGVSVSVLVGVALGVRVLLGGVQVGVKNDSGEVLQDVTIWYTGGKRQRGILQTGSEFVERVQPESESHIEVTYRPRDGKLRRHVVKCYFESGYRGSVAVQIGRGGVVSSSADIKLPWPAGII